MVKAQNDFKKKNLPLTANRCMQYLRLGGETTKTISCYVFENKRAMMALNRSPESVYPQNEFYLLYYYCSNL